MIDKLNSVSYKVKVLLPRPEDFGKVGEKELMFILPSDSKRWSKSRIDATRWRYLRSFVKESDNIKWESVEIDNTRFSLELMSYENDYDFPDYGLGCYLVRLYHPELNHYPFPFVTFINAKTLLRLISRSGFVSDNKIHGNFCCVHADGTSGIWSTVFNLENPEDKALQEKKEFGKRLSSEKKTTKWEPGNVYFLTNGEKVLYVGQISDVLDISETRTGPKSPTGGYSINTDILRWGITSQFQKKTGHLFMYLDGGSFEDFVNGFGPEQNVSTILHLTLLHSINNGSEYELDKNFRFYFDKPKPGLFIEKKFIDDTALVNLGDILNKLLVQFTQNNIKRGYVSFPICSKYESFDEPSRNSIDSKIVEAFKFCNDNINNTSKNFEVFYKTMTTGSSKKTGRYGGYRYNSISTSILAMIDKDRAKELYKKI